MCVSNLQNTKLYIRNKTRAYKQNKDIYTTFHILIHTHSHIYTYIQYTHTNTLSLLHICLCRRPHDPKLFLCFAKIPMRHETNIQRKKDREREKAEYDNMWH